MAPKKFHVYQGSDQWTAWLGLSWFWDTPGRATDAHGPYWKPLAYLLGWLATR